MGECGDRGGAVFGWNGDGCGPGSGVACKSGATAVLQREKDFVLGPLQKSKVDGLAHSNNAALVVEGGEAIKVGLYQLPLARGQIAGDQGVGAGHA